MKLPILVLAGFVALLGFAPAASAAEPAAGQPEPSARDRRYYFEHRLLPKWTHQSGGAFFRDLAANKAGQMLEAAAEIVGREYADSLKVRLLDDPDRILISFLEPQDIALCYHVLLVRLDGAFRFITLEMTEDLLGNGAKSVLGEWTAEGGHLNYGERTYSDGNSFLRETSAGLPGTPHAETSPAKPTDPAPPKPD